MSGSRPADAMLADLIPAEDGAVLGLVGTAKNSGKTTVLNWILEQLDAQDRVPGLVSIGFDGETRDFWLGVAKPAVAVTKGCWIASAERSLATGTAPVRIEARTGIQSPLGEIVIAQATESGTTVLAGMRHRRDVLTVCDLLRQQHVNLTIVDGAYHRRALADPGLTDSIVVATGAVLAGTPTRVATDTATVIEQLSLDRLNNDEEQSLISQAVSTGTAIRRGRDGSVHDLTQGALQLDPAEMVPLLQETALLAVPGVATDSLLEALCTCHPAPTLLLPNATHLVVKDKTWRRFRAHGGQVLVRDPIQIRAITVNPCGIRHADHNPTLLLEAVQNQCPTIPVYNVVSP